MLSSRSIAALLLLAVLPCTSGGVEIVRMDIQIGATQYDLDLELYDSVTPVTVTNFLNYVDDGNGSHRFDQSFIHRSITDFVIQGGGFTFDPLLGGFEYDSATDTYPGGLKIIPEDAPIINEFTASGLSNLRGTIAMARTSDPDSATSQWFINLVDNLSLDDGDGYAVFGRALDDGISILDQIAAVPVNDLSSTSQDFSDIPLSNYASGSAVTQDNLVRVNSVTSIQRAILKPDVDPLVFSLVVTGTSAQKTVHFSNRGNADLVMDGSSLAALTAPFGIAADTCSNNTLSPESVDPSDTCSVTIEFSPVTIGEYPGNLVITPSVNPHSISFSLAITGEGVPTTPVLSVQDNITSLDYPGTALGFTTDKNITIQNRGGGSLDISSVVITGQDAQLFSLDSGCSGTTSLLIGETCTLSVSFSPLTDGQKLALLSFSSNAGIVEIDLSGNGVSPEITVSTTSLNLGSTGIGQTEQEAIVITNTGTGNLDILSLEITGVDAADFSQNNNCPSVSTTASSDDTAEMGQGDICYVVINFTPATEGEKSAVISFTTNDVDNAVVEVLLQGVAIAPDSDNDGIPDTEEQNSPNAGDANNDDILDINQSNVASFLTLKGVYATIVSPPGTSLDDTSLVPNPSPDDMPGTANFWHGAFRYNIDSSSFGNAVIQVGVLLPADDASSTYYKYGPAPDNTDPHWYNFSYDTATGTGAQYLGQVTIEGPDGSKINRNMFILNYIDGQRGDDDLTLNGEIVTTGAVSPAATDSSGAMSWYLTVLLLVFLRLCRPGCSRAGRVTPYQPDT